MVIYHSGTKDEDSLFDSNRNNMLPSSQGIASSHGAVVFRGSWCRWPYFMLSLGIEGFSSHCRRWAVWSGHRRSRTIGTGGRWSRAVGPSDCLWQRLKVVLCYRDLTIVWLTRTELIFLFLHFPLLLKSRGISMGWIRDNGTLGARVVFGSSRHELGLLRPPDSGSRWWPATSQSMVCGWRWRCRLLEIDLLLLSFE